MYAALPTIQARRLLTEGSRNFHRQILRYVDAVSLIHLRETSKTLYRLLSGPDGASIWSHALAEEGVPVLKAGLLTPWQYAEMALWKRCTVRRRCIVCRSLLDCVLSPAKSIPCHAQNCTKTQFIPDFYVLRRYCREFAARAPCSASTISRRITPMRTPAPSSACWRATASPTFCRLPECCC